MSFLKSLTESILGKPNNVNTGGINKGEPKTFPVVYVEHSRCHLDGNKMQVYCSILNSSPMIIELDKIHMLGTSRVLGNFLKPKEEHECLVYDGPHANNEHDYELHLDYKDHTGDYFRSVHDIKFTYQAKDKTYIIDEIRLRLPIRDING